MSVKVSVLTPVYNVEDYLRQCLDSLVAQTLTEGEIEFIVVNDGSTDGSLEIIKEYASKDPRFVVIDKENGGYGTAMNAGLKKAQGEYVGILESDDFAEPQMFETLYKAASENNCDLVKCNYYEHNSALGSFEKENFSEELCGQVFNPADPAWTKVIYTIPAIWTGLYRRSHLQEYGISFLETPGASFQDTGFVFKNWAAASRVFCIHDYLLHYRVNRAGSSVKGDSKVYNVCVEWDSIMEFLDSHPGIKEQVIDFFQAQRLATYVWNYGRISRQYRREFLDRVAADYKKAQAAGELNPERYATRRWERLMLLLEDPDALYEQDCQAWQLASPPKVSVIVPVYNAEAYVGELIDSLKKQTLRKIEVILVDDGSTDDSLSLMKKLCKGDSRFRIFHKKNGGVGSARNTGLFYARGTYIIFADADDVIPDDAYENLYRSMKLNDADMAIGAMEEFSLVESTVYPQTKVQSETRSISPIDKNFMFTLTLCNKMLKRAIIEDKDLGFLDYTIGEDAYFLSCYLRYARNVVGCPHVVYRYRKLLWFQGSTATNRVDVEAITALIESHMRAGNRFLENMDELAAEERADGRDVDADLALANKVLFQEQIAKRIYGLSIDRHYRHIWTAENPSDVVACLNSMIDEFEPKLSRESLEGLRGWFSEIPFNGSHLPSTSELAAAPLISVILLGDGSQDLIARQCDSLYRQNFPAFELLVREEDLAFIPSEYAHCENIRTIPAGANSLADYLAPVRSPFVNILDGKAFHSAGSLKLMQNAVEETRADFLSFNMVLIDKNGKRVENTWLSAAFKPAFSDTPSLRHPISKIDYLLCNKVFKRASFEDFPDLLAASPQSLASSCYEKLSFHKRRTARIVCFESQDSFISHLDPRERASLEKLGPSGYASKFKENQKKRKLPDKAKRKISRMTAPSDIVLFFTRRNGRKGLSENLKLVYEALDCGNKVVMCEPLPHSSEYTEKLKETIRRARVIVTDDYCPEISQVKRRKDCKVIQLWHACGAFKKFGLDYPGASISVEKSMHKGYSLVSVSSPFVRRIYARAFGISLKKVKALGSPRTDALLDSARMDEERSNAIEKLPALQGKRVVLYAPTFRQKNGKQVAWDSKIDWQELSDSLPEDVALIVNGHPLESTLLVRGSYPNIVEKPKLSEMEIAAVADCLITDYSSIVFDFALMDKPFVFYCPDINESEMDFYLDYPDDFGSLYCESFEDLLPMIEKALNQGASMESLAFKEKYMGACDGNSTERIVGVIKKWLSK